jgi:putative tricarboxylic transport membrane protein
MKLKAAFVAAAVATLGTTSVNAQWAPTKPVEFVVTAGAGGGTDIFARTVQAIVTKYNLMPQPVVVQIKGGGSGAEGYIYTRSAEGDAHKLVFGTQNSYALPLGAKVAYTHEDMTPVAAMALDEFLLWVKGDSPIKTVKEFVDAAKSKTMKIAGAQSKDSDEIVTKLMEKAIGAKIVYVPFKSGGEADVQLTGGHVDAHVNNPSESIGSWRAGKARPLCVFNREKLPAGPKVTDTQAWSDIPTCSSQGLAVDQYTQPRLVLMPPKVPAEAAAYYAGILKKVSETPEWKEYIDKTGQSNRHISGDAFKTFIATDFARFKQVFTEQNWLVK